MLSSPVMAGFVRDGVWTLPRVATSGTNTHRDLLAERYSPTANFETNDVCGLASREVRAFVPPMTGVIRARSGQPPSGRSD